MTSLRTFLETRIARRVFGLFLLCAAVPAVTLAGSGYWLVRREMREQAGLQLAQASKISGTLLLARLHGADEELQGLRAALRRHQRPAPGGGMARFRSLTMIGGQDSSEVLWGASPLPLPALPNSVRAHLLGDRPAVVVQGAGTAVRIYLVRNLGGTDPGAGQLWAEVSTEYLWGDGETEPLAPDGVALCVFGPRAVFRVLCSSGADPIVAHGTEWGQGRRSSIITAPSGELATGSSTVFLGFEFAADPWTVVLAQPLGGMASASAFGRTVLFTLIIGLCLVVLASNILLRQRLDPVARLQAGTRRLAEGDFAAQVEVSSGDELEDLANSFNTMATGLREQFDLLAALQAVDREALRSQSDEGIVVAAMPRLSALAPAGCGVSVAVARRAREVSPLTLWTSTPDGALGRVELQVPTAALDRLGQMPPAAELPAGESVAGVLPAPGAGESGGQIVLPLLEHGAAFGVVVLALAPGEVHHLPPHDTERLRQLADQVALGLSHQLVLDRLGALSWGTLQALARTIDANSPWTAGHSERVTRVAMAIGRQMALEEPDIERLHRGGLLHDVGKIGIPPAVLDKPGELDDAEMALIRAHPVVGARILQPILAFEDVIGIVRHHHERFDGTGYPDRLAGARIPFLARVLAVADVYDALVSRRPYRAGWPREAAIEHIAKGAGSHFDPVVVEAFLELVESDEWAAVSDGVALEPAAQFAGSRT
jgi:putative nucleotidyltransferase with HDIG domain